MKKVRSMAAAFLVVFFMTPLSACGSTEDSNMDDSRATTGQTREETRASTSREDEDEGGIIDDVMDDMEEGADDLKEKAEDMTRQTEE